MLLVEDDEQVLGMAVESLEELRYRVVVARNAAEALEHLAGVERIDILFSDVVMPGGMNGSQLAVEAQRLRPGIKVLLTSGYVANLDEGQVIGHGELPVLTSPTAATSSPARCGWFWVAGALTQAFLVRVDGSSHPKPVLTLDARSTARRERAARKRCLRCFPGPVLSTCKRTRRQPVRVPGSPHIWIDRPKVIVGIHGLANKPPVDEKTRWWRAAISEGLARNEGLTNAALRVRLRLLGRPALRRAALRRRPSSNPNRPHDGTGPLPGREDAPLLTVPDVLATVYEGIDRIEEATGITLVDDLILEHRFDDLWHYHVEQSFAPPCSRPPDRAPAEVSRPPHPSRGPFHGFGHRLRRASSSWSATTLDCGSSTLVTVG